jgi:hypothetical protein
MTARIAGAQGVYRNIPGWQGVRMTHINGGNGQYARTMYDQKLDDWTIGATGRGGRPGVQAYVFWYVFLFALSVEVSQRLSFGGNTSIVDN